MQTIHSWVIEYSHSEEAYHIGRMADMLRRNIHSLSSQQMSDYICVGVFPTHERAIDAVLEFRRNRVPGFSLALPI